MFSQLGEAFPLGNAASYNECLKPYVTVHQTGAFASSTGAVVVVSLQEQLGALYLVRYLR